VKKGLFVIVLLAALAVSALTPFAGRALAAAPAAPAAGGMQTHAGVFDKTRFVLHMGFAYYAIHHFVYDRFRHKVVQADGTVTYENLFAKGAPHRIANLVKAALAILFAVHELKVSYKIAQNMYAKLRGCQSSAEQSGSAESATPTPLPTAEPAPSGTPLAGSTCQYSDQDITNLNSGLASFGKQASQDGVTITDRTVPIPGAA
jgi:hypothetical protein